MSAKRAASDTRPDMVGLIDRLGRTAQECRELIREMHEAQQALKATIKEARQLRSETVADMNRLIGEEMERYRERVGEAAHAGYERVILEFDRLAEPMYETLGLMENLIELRNARSELFSACVCGDRVIAGNVHAADGHPIAPTDGDFDICGECFGLKVFTGNGLELRDPTEAELRYAARSREAVRTLSILTLNTKKGAAL